ncbi:MAG: hypothetical protein M3N12_07070, partial [Verrucomicrobiota bacterium]|nr:hypothetical protein [Verrucomicrobiota bacterium]
MKTKLLALTCIAGLAALYSVPVQASGADDHPTPTPSPSASPGGSPSPTPSPSASPSPGDDHGGHGDLSLHGLFEGTTSAGGIVVMYVERNTHLQVNFLDVTGQTIGFGEGELVNSTFSFNLSNGQTITGTAGEHAITGTVGGATYQASRPPEFGEEHNATGRFAGVAVGPNGESRVLFTIDPNGRITMVQTSGTSPNQVRVGGFGTITAPVAPATNYTFSLSRTIGSTSTITGSFTITDGVFQGTFTTSAGTFTVNSFKSTLANHMA